MSEWIIIGKHPEGMKYKDARPWKQLNSIGLNEAAILYRTRWAASGHGKQIEMLHKAGYRHKLIIPDYAFDNNFKFKGGEQRIKQKWIDTSKPQPYSDILDLVQMAIKKQDGPYIQLWSILHLAIFWALKQDCDKLTLIGCNGTKGVLPGMLHGKNIEYMRQHTEMIVKACQECGVEVDWLL